LSESTLQSYRLLENVIFLKKAQVFSAVETADLRAVATIVEELAFKSGEVVVKEGDVGDSMYVIKEGRVTITKSGGGDSAIVLAELTVGDCFGDMAVVDAEVRSASAIAREACVLLRITRDDLNDVILECPPIALGLLKVFVKRLRSANATIQTLSAKGHGNT
jgi:CRP/FNR family transcriptional regulator, cyclic AMP receptor protein